MKKPNQFKHTEVGMIPEDWEVDKLENHLTIKGRIGWKGLQISEYVDEGPFIVGGLQIKENTVVWEECAHISEARYNESPEIMLHESDILMTKDGTIGKLAYIKSLPYKATVAAHIHVIRKNSDKILPQFLFYFFKSAIFQNLVESKISGSVVPALTQKDINSTEFPIPPMSEQQNIAKILSDLDFKIELNRKMNKTLEEICKIIFRHWFIDFEFPNKDGKPYKSSGGEMVYNEELEKQIPKGWEISNIDKEFNLIMGQSPPGISYNETGDGIIFFQGRTDFGHRFPSIRMFCTKPTRFAKKADTLISVRAPVGDINLALQDCCIGRGLAAIRHKSNDSSYTYYFMMTLKPIFDHFEAEGTVFGSMGKTDFEKIKVLAPPMKIIQSFQKIANLIDKKIEYNTLQMLTLSSIRDSLVPRLMTGKMRVTVGMR